MGKNMRNLYNFAKKYHGEWHSWHNDRATRNAIKSLLKLNVIKINKYNQFKFVSSIENK